MRNHLKDNKMHKFLLLKKGMSPETFDEISELVSNSLTVCIKKNKKRWKIKFTTSCLTLKSQQEMIENEICSWCKVCILALIGAG